MPLSDVAYPGKSYQQMGLSMGAEFWYRARLVDRLGNESPWTGWVQGMASDNFDDYYENLTDAIKDTDAWEETQRTISETQEGIRNTQQELEQTAEELRQEAADQAKQVSQDIDASAKSITADVDGKISAVNKTITDELTSVNESLDSGLAQANKGIQEAKSAVADANQQIAILSKSLADGDAALNAQIKTAENGLKQSLSQVNTTLTNAVKQETADRIADVNAKAAQAADELLAATQGIEASIESLTQVMKSADENLAREMSSLAAALISSSIRRLSGISTIRRPRAGPEAPAYRECPRMAGYALLTAPPIRTLPLLAVWLSMVRRTASSCCAFVKPANQSGRVRSVGCLPAKTSITRSDTLLLSQNMPMGWQP